MAFQGLLLNQNNLPDGNQPVPLRLASFIGGWSVNEYFNLLTSPSNLTLGFKATVYQYQQGYSIPLIVNPATISRLYSAQYQHSEALFLQAIDDDYFIWSDNVQSQINAYARNILGGDVNAQAVGYTYYWNPALSNHQQIIAACSDFHDLLTTTQKKKSTTRKRKAIKQAEYQSWCQEHKRLKSAYNSKHQNKSIYSYQQSARNIFADPKLNPNKKVTQAHIAKMIGRYCK